MKYLTAIALPARIAMLAFPASKWQAQAGQCKFDASATLRGASVKRTAFLLATALAVGGCTTTGPSRGDPRELSTLQLCHALASGSDQQFRNQVAQVLVRRGATAEKCQRLIANDKSIATGIAVAGVAVAAGAAAANNGYGGGGYYGGGYDYDYAWDYLPGNGQWACRGKQTGHFAYPSHCQLDPVNDFTWPG